MSEDKAGKIIQYYWKAERRHQKRHTVARDLMMVFKGGCARPIVGYKWRYYDNSDENRQFFAKRDYQMMNTPETEGKVISWNKRTGIVLTDAGEILIRG